MDSEVLRTPLVDHAERHLLDLVMSLKVLYDLCLRYLLVVPLD
jgi:hypothetical protein